MRIIILVISVFIILSGCKQISFVEKENNSLEHIYLTQEKYFPTQKWRLSTPEAQGMDSTKLVNFFNKLNENTQGTHSAIIIRNGYIVAEKYSEEYSPEIKQRVFSATKSVISALIGIAIDQGNIKLEDRVVDIFSEYQIQNLDNDKKQITVKDLLSMRSGIHFNDIDDYRRTLEAQDPVQFILDQPMRTAPGNQYNYSSGDSHLLSAIIQKKTGMKTTEFADQYLFEPLNIKNREFIEKNNVALGGNGLVLTPRDMAKIGLLYLNDGEWDGKKVLSQDWVKESTTKSSEERFIGVGGSYYGYQWYIDEIDNHYVYYAQGAFGQFLYVIPELGIVIVFTTGLEAPYVNSKLTDLLTLILNSVVSTEALEPNNEDYRSLVSIELKDSENTENNKQLTFLKEEITKIDGHTYSMNSNEINWKDMTLTFINENEAQMKVLKNDGHVDEYLIGTNGVPLVNYPSSGVYSILGYWQNNHTFVVRIKNLEQLNEYSIRLTFKGDNYQKLEGKVIWWDNYESGLSGSKK